MDIHKPKPWHGLREFLKEYLIIVVGVLTALGGEQVVEWIHRGQEVEEARQSLRQEMTHNASLMQYSLAAAPCFQRHLDTLAAWANGGPPPIWDRGPLDTLGSSAWEEAKVAAVAHMPLKERIAYDRYYATVADRADVIRSERASMVVAAGLSAQPQVPPQERINALQDVARIKAQQTILSGYDRNMLATSKAMGVSPPPFTATQAARLARECEGTGGPAAS
jgi:hypothetical protein